MGVTHHRLQGLQHGRVQVVVQIGDPRVVAVHRQQVLGQVVGTYRQKVHLTGQLFGLVHRRRDFDHHANRRHRHVGAFVAHFTPGAVQQVQGFFEFVGAGDHRQQDAQVVQAFAGLEHGPGLHQKDFRVVEGHADPAPAQERVVFFDREVRQRLVAANVQAAHGHRLRMEGRQLLAINRQLLFFTREALVDHERHFGAVQTNAFCATLLRTGHIGQQAGVDPQRHAVAVRGDARQLAQGVEALGQLAFFFNYVGVLLAQHVAGVGVDLTVVAVDDHLDAVDLGVRQVNQAHHGRDAHGTGQNRHVGVTRTQYRNQAHQLAFRHFAKHGRGQLFTDQNGVVGVDHGLLVIVLQIGQQAAPEVTHVRRPLAQVVVVHQFETVDVISHHLTQRALGPLTGLDHIFDFAAQRGVVEHHQVHVEQRLFFGAQLRGELFRHRAHVVAHAFEGVFEQRYFGRYVSDGLVGHHVQIGRRQHDHRRTDRRAG